MTGRPPLYQRVAAQLRELIESGDLAGQLPTNLGLAADFGVSEGTVRWALGLLAAEGLIRAHPRRGTFVVHR